MPFANAFVAKLVRDFSSRESAQRALVRAFARSFEDVKESLEKYIQGFWMVNLKNAEMNARQLLWLIERMIELRVADTAVKEWSGLPSFMYVLQEVVRDDGFPVVLLQCTSKLASAIASGAILAPRQVRMEFIRSWLPVLVVFKDDVECMPETCKPLYMELEETFLRIISTLPIADAQELLQQCLSFASQNVEDCPNLVFVFKTLSRRCKRTPQARNHSYRFLPFLSNVVNMKPMSKE